ncbi:hypothetical protein QTL94_13800 [Rhizobium sp. S96]|nr:hypothetical protein [Rhizobium sp. S96]
MDNPALLAHFRVNALLSIRFPETSAMWKTSSKLVSLAIATLIALPAAAGDFGGRAFPRHHGFGNGPSLVGQHGGWRSVPAGFTGRHFADGHDGFDRRHFRNRLLKRFDSPSTNFARNNVVIVVQGAQAGGAADTYAGSSFVYDANGGTYVGGSSGSFYRYQPTVALAPVAKVINVTAKSSGCSYEAGVCVIRP